MSGIAAVKPEALGEEDDAYAAYGHRPSPVQPPPQRQPTKSAQPDAGQPPGLGVLGSPVKVEVGADSGHSSPTQHSGGAESAVATQHRGIGGGDRCLVGAAAGCKDDGDDDFSSSDCLSGEDDGDCEEPIDDDFGELTSLAWLLNANLLRKSGSSGDSRGRRRGHQAGQSTSHDGGSGGCCSASVAEAPTFRQWAAPECGGVDRKPPYSFSCLIFMAIEESPGRRLPVKDVYDWISRNFPYYQSAPTGWKNSVRHNLSLNKCFRKIEHGEYRSSGGKGAQWCIEPAYRPKLLQALRRSPQYQRHQTHAETLTDSLGRLTKRLLGEASAIDEKAPRVDIDAANALVSLRHVPPSKREVSPDSAAQVSVVDSRPLSPSSCSRDAVLDGEHGGRKRKLCSEPSATVAAGGSSSSSSKAPAVLTDVPSLDHTYVVSTASPAAECLRAQRPSMADDDHVGFHHRDDVASRGNSEEASSSDGEPSAAVPSPPPAPAPASAAPPCRQAGPQRVERNRRVLQAYGRATLAVASRSSSRRRRLKAADVAGDASSRSLLSLASAASLAMMDAGLGRPVA